MSDKNTTVATAVGAAALLAVLVGVNISEKPREDVYIPFDQREGSSSQVLEDSPRDVDPTGDPDWNTISSKVMDSVVSLNVRGETTAGQGSGIMLDESGNILTNAHVVKGASADGIAVVLNDSSVYEAKLVASDVMSDLAVVKIKDAPAGLVPMEFNSSDLEVGDPVMAIGSPLGLSGTVTTGILSSLNRPVAIGEEANMEDRSIILALQTNAAINPGNSGGALVNAQGELIGVNSAIATDGVGTGSIGIGFSIPVTTVEIALDYLLAGKPFPHARMGVMVSQGTAEADGRTLLGARIQEVATGSAADSFGLKTGDVILSVNGVRVSSQDTLVGIINSQPAGGEITLDLIRRGGQETVNLTLESNS